MAHGAGPHRLQRHQHQASAISFVCVLQHTRSCSVGCCRPRYSESLRANPATAAARRTHLQAAQPAVFVDKTTKVICQGLTGKNGTFHTEQVCPLGRQVGVGDVGWGGLG